MSCSASAALSAFEAAALEAAAFEAAALEAAALEASVATAPPAGVDSFVDDDEEGASKSSLPAFPSLKS